jgi:hypothetical protein
LRIRDGRFFSPPRFASNGLAGVKPIKLGELLDGFLYATFQYLKAFEGLSRHWLFWTSTSRAGSIRNHRKQTSPASLALTSHIKNAIVVDVSDRLRQQSDFLEPFIELFLSYLFSRFFRHGHLLIEKQN